jgi:mannose-6-phosphate isomerase-like protein (cupin superfamily)
MLESINSILKKIAIITMTPNPGARNQIKNPADSGWKNKKIVPKPGKPSLKPKLLKQPQPKPGKKPEPEQKPPQNPSNLELNLMENKNRIEKSKNREQQMLNREQQQSLKKDTSGTEEDTADIGQDHLKKINDLEKKKNVIDTKLVNVQRSKKALSGIFKDIVRSSLIKFIAAKASELKGFVTDIEKDTVENDNFRKVLYTGKNSQLVLMSLKPGEEIGMETHDDTDQFFRVDAGSGRVIINGNETEIKNGSAIVIPQGAKHNVINTGREYLKLYSIYSPPHHADKTLHKTKEEAEASDEHYDGKTTE